MGSTAAKTVVGESDVHIQSNTKASVSWNIVRSEFSMGLCKFWQLSIAQQNWSQVKNLWNN